MFITALVQTTHLQKYQLIIGLFQQLKLSEGMNKEKQSLQRKLLPHFWLLEWKCLLVYLLILL